MDPFPHGTLTKLQHLHDSLQTTQKMPYYANNTPYILLYFGSNYDIYSNNKKQSWLLVEVQKISIKMENTGAHLASTWAQANKVICTILSLLLFIAVLVFATGPWLAVPMVNVTAGNTADSKSPASSSMSGNPRDVEGFGDTADCGAGTKTVFGFPWPWSLELIENRLSSPRPRQDGFKLPWV